MNQWLLLNISIRKIIFLIMLLVFSNPSFSQISRSTNLTGDQKCLSYSDEDSRNRCMALLKRGSPVGDSYCRKLSNPDSVNACLATTNRQPAYCSSINSPKFRESCFKNLGAGGTNSLSGSGSGGANTLSGSASGGANTISGSGGSNTLSGSGRSNPFSGAGRINNLPAAPSQHQDQKSVIFLKKKYIYANRSNDHAAYINHNDYLKFSADVSSRYRKIELLTIMDNVNRYASDMGRPRLYGSYLGDYEYDCEKNKFRITKLNMFGGKDGSSPFNEKDVGTDEWSTISSTTQIGGVGLLICSKYDARASQIQSESPHVGAGVQKVKSTTENLGNSISCASIKGAEMVCDWDFNAFGKPRIKSQQSKTACVEGKTYFLDYSNNSIVVKSGCRAIFGN